MIPERNVLTVVPAGGCMKNSIRLETRGKSYVGRHIRRINGNDLHAGFHLVGYSRRPICRRIVFHDS